MELPEIYLLSRDMYKELKGKTVNDVEVKNVKCLNLPFEEFRSIIVGKKFLGAKPKGKWVSLEIEDEYTLLYNTGMGANTIYYQKDDQPQETWHIKFRFEDGSGFTSRVWWFCYLHLLKNSELASHKMTAKLGPTPLDSDFSEDYLNGLFIAKRSSVKNILMDQSKVAGIGNVYIHDPLFLANVHPLRQANTITRDELTKLYASIKTVINESISCGGLAYEVNFYGVKGDYGKNRYRVAYKEGEACPICGETIQKIKTGSTSSYICPKCQPL
ncbi:Fpg/Nei family DNA glycosylase [Candidatus Bathyarchaeota archaeon]|nr:Fpg/Nei family DNA glycosylase [Candidatus Bathyarchaeota archaeon]